MIIFPHFTLHVFTPKILYITQLPLIELYNAIPPIILKVRVYKLDSIMK